MAFVKVVVVNEDTRPTAGVDVEAVATSDRTVSAVQETDRAGQAVFTGLTGPHFFRPRIRRTSGNVGGRSYTGQIKVQIVALSGSICYDYVVDSNGMGTHTTLFGSTGALEEAIGDAASRNILVMGEHSESIGSVTTISALASDQKITVTSCGPYRPTITTDNSNESRWIAHTASSSAGSVLRFEGLNFDRPTAAGSGAFYDASGGVITPKLELVDIFWSGSKWSQLLWFRTSGGAVVEDVTFDRCQSDAAITSLIATGSSAAMAGKFIVRNCDWDELTHVSSRTDNSDLDPGLDGIEITNNLFRLITGYVWQLSFNRTFTFKDNIVLEYSSTGASHRCIDIGTAGTTDPKDVVIADNYIYCSRNEATSIAVRAGAGGGGVGELYNISIVGNSFRGGGSGTAVALDEAQNDCVVLNSYRDWTTTVGGEVGPDSGTVPYHNLLDANIHLDTTADGVTRGSIIIGNSTPAWDELVVGANKTILQSDGTDPAWVAPATAIGHAILDGSIHTDSVADGVTAGSIIIGNDTPKWDELVISVPNAGSRNVLGIDNGETVPSWKGNDLLADADGDTYHAVEVSADEDVHYFYAAGTKLMTIGHDGAVDISHTAAAPGEHGLELIVDAAGKGNIHALDIVLTTGAIGAGDDAEAILVNIDESGAGGGNVVALEVLATEGSADIHAVEAGILVGPILQFSGTFGDMDVALVKAVDTLTEFTTSGNNIVFFVADNDTITIGDAAQFFELEFLLATVASKDVKPTFEYSKAGGLWEPFSPADGTNGMQNTGVIAWEADDVASPAWVVHSGNYRIRIKRTRGESITSPIEDKVQIADVIVFEWDKLGDLIINTLSLSGDIDLNGNDIDDGGVIFLREQANADADVGNQGQLWMKTGAPTEFMFTDDAGADRTIIWAGGAFHGGFSDVGVDDHTQYALLAGRSGGQTLAGGDAAGEDFTIKSTGHATRGSTFIGGPSQFELDETTGQVKLPTGGSGAGLLIGSDVQLYRSAADTLRTPDSLIVDGNVGIGTTSPQELLHVGAGTDASDISATDLLVTRAGPSNLSVRDSTNNVETFLFASSVGGIMGTITNDPLDIRTNNTNAIFIDASQNVGIGEVAPDSKLEVNGTLHITGNSTLDGLLTVDTISERTAGVGIEAESVILRDGLVWGQTLHPELGIGDQIELTLSGNEITDKTRALALEGDGRVFPDSSFGIWEATTNLLTNGGFESNAAAWATFGSNTIGVSTAQFKFGAQSGLCTYQDNTILTQLTAAFILTAATHICSLWVFIPSDWDGGTIRWSEAGTYAGASGAQAVNANMALTDQWQRISFDVTPVGGDLAGTMRLDITGGAPTAGRFVYVDGIQVELQPIATPYVETDGGTASRTAARVRATTIGVLDVTQGWFAARLRMGWLNTGDPSTDVVLARWADADNDIIELRYDTANDQWEIDRQALGTGDVHTFADTFSEGSMVTVIGYWTGTAIALSIDGAAFTTTAQTVADIPTLAATTIDIGSNAATEHIDSDVLWVAMGTGTLTNSDARLINACGNTAPNRSVLPTVSQPTFLWDANTGAAGPDILVQDPLLLNVDYSGVKLGFFGATPVAQQTGVGVNIAETHAALVNLGLITA